jgi:hypothetical protein
MAVVQICRWQPTSPTEHKTTIATRFGDRCGLYKLDHWRDLVGVMSARLVLWLLLSEVRSMSAWSVHHAAARRQWGICMAMPIRVGDRRPPHIVHAHGRCVRCTGVVAADRQRFVHMLDLMVRHANLWFSLLLAWIQKKKISLDLLA